MSYIQNFDANPMAHSKSSQIPYMIQTNMQKKTSAAEDSYRVILYGYSTYMHDIIRRPRLERERAGVLVIPQLLAILQNPITHFCNTL